MSKKNNEKDSDGPVVSRRSFFKQDEQYICSSCLAVKDQKNDLHREFKTHKLYEWEMIDKKVLCARCVCLLFAPGNRRN